MNANVWNIGVPIDLRNFGERPIVFTGLLAGLTSSTTRNLMSKLWPKKSATVPA